MRSQFQSEICNITEDMSHAPASFHVHLKVFFFQNKISFIEKNVFIMVDILLTAHPHDI